MTSQRAVKTKHAYQALVNIKATRLQLDTAFPTCHAAVSSPGQHETVAEAYDIAVAALLGLERVVRDSAGLPHREVPRRQVPCPG